jgi:capsular polysaccharide biosynthesis protein
MDLRVYLKLFRHWLWLIVLTTVVGVVASLCVLLYLGDLPSYSATATVAIGAEIFSSDQDQAYLIAVDSMAPTYVELAKLEPVTQAVIAALSLPETTDELSDLLEVTLIEDTQLMEIEATYRDAQMAADIANEVAHQLALQAPTQLRNFIVTIEAAEAPELLKLDIEAFAPVAIAGLLGFLLSTGGVFLVDFVRDVINDSEDVAQRLGLATLAVVRSPSDRHSRLWRRWPRRRAEPENQPVWWSLMEACQLRYAAATGQTPDAPHNAAEGNETPLIMITSPERDERQTSTALNLARTWARTGQTTLLVDAYLARPGLHEELGLTNEVGLTSLLAEPTCSLEAAIGGDPAHRGSARPARPDGRASDRATAVCHCASRASGPGSDESDSPSGHRQWPAGAGRGRRRDAGRPGRRRAAGLARWPNPRRTGSRSDRVAN